MYDFCQTCLSDIYERLKCLCVARSVKYRQTFICCLETKVFNPGFPELKNPGNPTIFQPQKPMFMRRLCLGIQVWKFKHYHASQMISFCTFQIKIILIQAAMALKKMERQSRQQNRHISVGLQPTYIHTITIHTQSTYEWMNINDVKINT